MDGKIQKYNDLRGFGFILVNFRERYFFHVSEWKCSTPPRIGDAVKFDVAAPKKDGQHPQANNVTPATAVSK